MGLIFKKCGISLLKDLILDQFRPMNRPDTPASTSPALNPHHYEAWIFDLDNTLYSARTNLFDQIDALIRTYICENLGLEEETASQLKRSYYETYGSSLRGLMDHHAIDPHDFLGFVHDIDLSILDPAPDLDRALAALPGRKLIFTSASTRHANRVMERLGIEAHFEDIYDIHAANYWPKPNPGTYDHMLETFQVDPKRSIFFEDMAHHLAPAAALGMTTVWVKGPNPRQVPAPEDDYVHHTTEDLPAWLAALKI